MEPRIGDADRDQAVAFLQEHMAQGRIDAGEFDDRMSRALKAKTASELAVLFEDLPEPRPPSTRQSPQHFNSHRGSSASSNIPSKSRRGSVRRPPALRSPTMRSRRTPERSKTDTVLCRRGRRILAGGDPVLLSPPAGATGG